MKRTVEESKKAWKKKTLFGYLLAALLALQPLVQDGWSLRTPEDRVRFIFRILIAVGTAVLGKYLGERKEG